MAEMLNKRKIAAAKKKLKQYKQKGKENQSNSKTAEENFSVNLQEETKERNITIQENSVFDSGPANEVQVEVLNGNSQMDKDLQCTEEPRFKAMSTADFFNSGNTEGVQELSVSSESKTFKTVDKSIFSLHPFPSNDPFNNIGSSPIHNATNVPHSSDIVAARNFFDSFASNTPASEPSVISSSVAVFFQDSPHVNPSEPLMLPQNRKESQDASVPETVLTLPVIEGEIPPISENSVIQSSEDHGISEDSFKRNANDNFIVLETSQRNLETSVTVADHKVSTPSDSSPRQKNVRSSTESLRQLSLQLNGLMEETLADNVGGRGDTELEQRNQELAALLASEKQKSEQLELQLKEYQSRMCQLQLDMDRIQTESETKLTRELGPLQEQLQLHVQTVGILVGEKTELQAALSKSQATAKQKASESEELQGRLKASRYRVSELEKEMSMARERLDTLERLNHDLSSEVDKLKQEQKHVQKQLSDTEEMVSELHLKLNAKTNECLALQQELQEKHSQLSLTQLRVQQLSTTDSSEVDSQLEALHQQKISLEAQVTELQQAIKAIGSERDQASQQYQQYVQQLNGQLQNLASKLESTTSENEQLLAREQSLVRHVSDLEKQLQQQNQKRQEASLGPMPQDARIQELETKISALGKENQDLLAELNDQEQEAGKMQQELQQSISKVEELQAMLERLQSEQPDTTKLLAAMESDKIAAATAIKQNLKLKEDLRGFTDVFAEMTNSKLELQEMLDREKLLCKEQGERIGQQETELNELRVQLKEKEKQIVQLEHKSSSYMLQQNQIADRMRHYEAQGHLTELLQQELEQAKERIQALSTQNNELRTVLAQQATHDSTSSSGAGSTEDTMSRKDDILATLSASVRQLELERDQLLLQIRQMEEQKSQQPAAVKDSGSDKLKAAQDLEIDYETMKVAMEKLEEKFTKTMKEVADLSDEKQRLEHLVLQLQGETETIGEYITLYQHQRSLLKKRALEKDEQLAKLARDKEEMRSKLAELNELVWKLVAEKETSKNNTAQMLKQVDVNNPTIATTEDLPNGELATIETTTETNEDNSNTVTNVLNEADTANKIMALLSEIGTSSLVDPQCTENFHPCPCCSGRLINV